MISVTTNSESYLRFRCTVKPILVVFTLNRIFASHRLALFALPRIKYALLCPIIHLGQAVQRVRKYFKKPNNNAPLCAVNIPEQRSKVINQESTSIFMRKVCEAYGYGGSSKFGFHPHEIGNKLVRLGATMLPFLKDHLPDKIMLLGRWKSRAFLVYIIRPQVTEWHNLYSIDMISFKNYFELFTTTKQQKSKPEENERRRCDYHMPHYKC